MPGTEEIASQSLSHSSWWMNLSDPAGESGNEEEVCVSQYSPRKREVLSEETAQTQRGRGRLTEPLCFLWHMLPRGTPMSPNSIKVRETTADFFRGCGCARCGPGDFCLGQPCKAYPQL